MIFRSKLEPTKRPGSEEARFPSASAPRSKPLRRVGYDQYDPRSIVTRRDFRLQDTTQVL